MELRQLRYFVAVAEELHFGRAAERLHIVQPAVSQQVRRLERELGVRLLDRTPRRVRLTAEGRSLLPEARSVLEAADRMATVAIGLRPGAGRAIRMGTGAGLSGSLAEAVGRLQRSTPDLRLELDSRPVARQLGAVQDGELDVALVRAAVPMEGVRVLELWREPLLAAVTAAHPAAAGDAVELECLADLPLRLPGRDRDPLLHDFVVRACRDAGFEPRLGRPTGAVEDAVVELGAGPPAWTVVHADTRPPAGSQRTAVLPFTPALSVPVALVVSPGKPSDCVHGLAAAFREEPTAEGSPEPAHVA
ncbi:LysR family transcriptional regulator [Nocardiopsis sediminis]|uniref:LysR family transcriptional regulator n=1 Tax=Nocardiopsis sediminis TaxID=1778267 RepID=A0ABV8FL90_9ACTN